MLKQRSISVTEEKRIVTGLITSLNFTKRIYPLFQLDYMTNSYLQIISEWCISFYEEHNAIPFKHIKDIYEQHVHKLKEHDAELIQTLLHTLSDQYDEEHVNVDYLVDCSIAYFRKRELEIAVNNISVLQDKGDVEGAERVIKDFSKVTITLDAPYIIDIGNIGQIEEIYRKREEEDKNFLVLPGDLGRYLGYHKRGDVVGFFAPSKRGKSWTLCDYNKHSILQRRKTAFWSIEMTDTEILPRVMKSFIPMVEEEGVYQYPTFDCIRNQTGECKDRESGVVILDGGAAIEDPAHKPCVKCMRGGQHKFEMTIYHDSIFRRSDDIFTIRDVLGTKDGGRSITNLMQKYGRLCVHKKYTLTYDLMMRDVEVMHARDGFIPDVLIIDYIDILGGLSSYDDYRGVDEAWKMLARIAGELNCLVVTATQGNKESHTTNTLDSTHQGGYYGKNQHVNLMVGINQTPEEKAQGVIRYGITEARGHKYIPGKTCTVLQDIGAGQAYLDSYYDYGTKSNTY